jgi:hypothetical protein
MSARTDRLTHDQINALDIPGHYKWFATLSLRGGVILLVAVALAGGVIGGLIGHQVRNHEERRYEATTATIIDTPELANGEMYRSAGTVSATVRTSTGLEVNMAVDDQAHRGDSVAVLIDRETGQLWRATTADETPLSDISFYIVMGALIGALAVLLTAVFLSTRCTKILEEGLDRRDNAKSAHYVH